MLPRDVSVHQSDGAVWAPPAIAVCGSKAREGDEVELKLELTADELAAQHLAAEHKGLMVAAMDAADIEGNQYFCGIWERGPNFKEVARPRSHIELVGDLRARRKSVLWDASLGIGESHLAEVARQGTDLLALPDWRLVTWRDDPLSGRFSSRFVRNGENFPPNCRALLRTMCVQATSERRTKHSLFVSLGED